MLSDLVVRDLHYLTTGHISRDNACTRIEVTQLSLVCGQSDRPLVDTQSKVEEDEKTSGDSRRPRWRSWSVTAKLIYIMGPTLKRSPNMKPTMMILGTLLRES